MLAIIAEDPAILERLVEEHLDPDVRRAVRNALDELGVDPRLTWGRISTKPRKESDDVPPWLRR